MEAAAAGIGKAVLNGVLSGAKAAITEDAALRQAVQRDVVFLTDELTAMRSYLRDADEERNRHKVTRSRVRHVRDLAYDVDDCLQEYAVHLEKPSGWRLARTVLERHRIAEEMKGLRARAEDMNHRILRYHLADENLPSANSGKPASISSSSAENSSSLGRTGVQRQVDLFLESGQVDLVPLICTNDHELRVIAVWGASGGELRKTSVIRKAYDDLKKNDQIFESCAWIRVAHPFNPPEFLQSIVRQFYMNSLQEAGKTGEEEATLGSQVLKKMETIEQRRFIDEFNKHVTHKRYLIVLNELSTIEDWDWIKTYFPNNKKGSRIIVSTEQGEVASLCAGPERLVVELKQSSTDQIIYAFCEKGITELESCSGTAATDSNNSADKMVPTTRIETTMEDALKESHFISRQDDINCIIEKLISSDNDDEEQDYEVISICGKGGLGKTSLVKSIYQNEELRSKIKFQKLAYVTIKHPFNLKDLLGSIVKQLDKENHGDRAKLEDQGQRLCKLLKDKKYLIVLDDLSSTDQWDNIKTYLPEKGKASWIIVTTSTENIAIHCSNTKQGYMHKLQSLGTVDARDLFKETVFRRTKDWKGWEHHPDLDIVAQSILEKCKGFPLAIITIGGVLAKRPKTSVEWRKLNEYIDAELKTNPELETTRTILLKCYDCLPYELKYCFLYLSIFPEDRIISRRRLVQRWVAEGYSIDEHSKSAKEIAEDYFMELIDRSMIIRFAESIGSTKGFDSCKFNNLIHEMSTSKSVEENLVLRLEAGCGLKTQGKIRHQSVSDNWNGGQNEFETIVHPSSIRSLTVFGKWRPFFMSERMRMLRVLDLEGTSGLNDHHLVHIGKLLHLKYLSLRGCHDIYYLPHSLGNLRQLETLDIKRTGIIKLSKTVIKLRKLHYLRAGGFLGSNIIRMKKRVCLLTCMSVGFCVACCAPQLMNEVVYETSGDPTRRDVCTTCCCTMFPFVARRLDASGVVMPSGVSKLAALHTLATVNIGRRTKAVLRGIRRLTRLRKLGVVGVNKENKKEFCEALSGLSNLETLSVQSSGVQEGLEDCLEFDDGFFSPPEKLKSLKLYGNLAKLPGWVDKLLNLVKLTLWGSRIQQAALQTLGKLPKLTILQLLQGSFQGQDLCLTFDKGEFSKLSRLALILPGDLKSVEFKQGATPELMLLQFCGRPGKSKDGFFSGLSSLKRLKEFMLDDDEYEEKFVADVRKQLTQNKNRPHFNRYNY